MPIPIDKLLDGARLWHSVLCAAESGKEVGEALNNWMHFRDNPRVTIEDAAQARAIGRTIRRYQRGIVPPVKAR